MRHIPGRHNTAADALSRMSFPSTVAPVAEAGPSSSSSTPLVVRDWMPFYRDDPDIASKYLSRDDTPLPHIRERDGVLWLDERILVPAARVHDVISAYHNDDHWCR